jgi:hypothetical protein
MCLNDGDWVEEEEEEEGEFESFPKTLRRERERALPRLRALPYS